MYSMETTKGFYNLLTFLKVLNSLSNYNIAASVPAGSQMSRRKNL